MIDGEWAIYRGQRGQNFVYANAKYEGRPRPDMWLADSCMTRGAGHDLFMASAEDAPRFDERMGPALLAAIATGAAGAAAGGLHSGTNQPSGGSSNRKLLIPAEKSPIITTSLMTRSVTINGVLMRRNSTALFPLRVSSQFDVIIIPVHTACIYLSGNEIKAAIRPCSLRHHRLPCLRTTCEPPSLHPARQVQSEVLDDVVLATVPDSWSWQHMHTRVSHMMLQVGSMPWEGARGSARVQSAVRVQSADRDLRCTINHNTCSCGRLSRGPGVLSGVELLPELSKFGLTLSTIYASSRCVVLRDR